MSGPIVLSEVHCYHVSLPARRRHAWAGFEGDIGSYVLIRAVSREGVSGWGEATALGEWGGSHGRHYGETPDTVMHLVRDAFTPAAVGQDLRSRRQIMSSIDLSIKGHHFAKAGFANALLDLHARHLSIPVWELLGGKLRSSIPIAHSIGFLSLDAAVAEAAAVVREGVRAIKIKVGRELDQDVETVRAIRAEVGESIRLSVDANQSWSRAEALRAIRALSDFGLHYVEEPVAGLDALAAVQAGTDIPLVADESFWGVRDALDLVSKNAVSIASIYVGKAGGVERALGLDVICADAAIGTNVNGSGETGVGNLANLTLAAMLHSLSESCVIPISTIADKRSTEVLGIDYLDDVLVDSMTYRDGAIEVPEGPGWGIDVDLDKVERYSEDSFMIDCRS